jgi:hypothetical protein
VEGGFAALQFKSTVVAVVIAKPQAPESHCDDNAVDHTGGGKIKHAGEPVAETNRLRRSSQVPCHIGAKKRADHEVGASW